MDDKSKGGKSWPEEQLPPLVVLHEGEDFEVDDDRGAIERVLGELARRGYDLEQAKKAGLMAYAYDASVDPMQRKEFPITGNGFEVGSVEDLARELTSYSGTSPIATAFQYTGHQPSDWKRPTVEICSPDAFEAQSPNDLYGFRLTKQYVGGMATIMTVEFQVSQD